MPSVSFDGCELCYTVRGSGPAVLLIQGVGVQGDAWTPQTDDLARDFTCVTFDNRGMARSQPPGAAITVEQMARDALRDSRLRRVARGACRRSLARRGRGPATGDHGALAGAFPRVVVHVFRGQDRGAADRANALARCANAHRHQADAAAIVSAARHAARPDCRGRPTRRTDRHAVRSRPGRSTADCQCSTPGAAAVRHVGAAARALTSPGLDHDRPSRSDRTAVGGSRTGRRDPRRSLRRSVGRVAWITDQSCRVDKRLASRPSWEYMIPTNSQRPGRSSVPGLPLPLTMRNPSKSAGISLRRSGVSSTATISASAAASPGSRRR